MAKYESLNHEILRTLCSVMVDDQQGLTGSEIAKFLLSAKIEDPMPSFTKRERLFEALSRRQTSDDCANNVLSFLMKVMSPVNYVGKEELFGYRLQRINSTIQFAGYEINNNGELAIVAPVRNLDESRQRADKLTRALHTRKVHPRVLQYCKPELLQENYFHAVLESAKSVFTHIRKLTGLDLDGAELVDKAFKSSDPYLIINSFVTETEKTEQAGFGNIMKGLFGMFRNPTAHVAKIDWAIHEEDALDVLTLISLIHKRLDKAVVVKEADVLFRSDG